MIEIMSYYNPKWLGYTGILTSIVTALGYPIFGLLLSNILFILMDPFSPSFAAERNTWNGIFVGFAILIGVFTFAQKYIFGYVGENLTYAVRRKLFVEMLYKQVAWFDTRDRAPGILTTILSEDIAQLNGLTTETISLFLEAILEICLGIILALIYEWRIALITAAVSPFIFVGGVMMSKLQWKGVGTKAGEGKDAY